jgi:3-phenylpropionate/trans-cinnamate dioxygenase ferredoxin component
VKGFVKVASLSAIADDTAVHVEVGNVPVCLARSGGEVMAILDECSHAEVSLSDGEVENCTIECWLHGSRFDLRTGKPTGLPATEAVPVYPVRIDGDDIYVAVKE